MIEVENLTKRYGEKLAVDGLDFVVQPGVVTGFLGPNGAGKTTTMRILAGVFPPTGGTVRIAGRDPMREPLACRGAVGYFPEYAPFYPDLRVAPYLRFVARLKRIPRARRADAVNEALTACGLEGVSQRAIGTLSKGYRQRVGLAQALCGNPPILILDEPTIGLDPGQVVEIRDLVRSLRGDRTVFFSSHILSEVAAVCERVIVIARGRLVGEGTPDELNTRLGRRRRVVIRVDGPPDDVAAALAAVPGVLRVERRESGLALDAAEREDVVRAAGAAVQQRGWSILELREESIDLEEIFLRLVRDGDTAS